MVESFIVRDEILINQSPEKVWKVLTTPEYVAQWDDLPEDYPDEPMTRGSKVVWDHPNGGKTVTTVIKEEEMQELIIDLYSSSWEVKPNIGEVAYKYMLEDHNGSTLLKIEIGDFSVLSNGKDYYDASVEFANESKKIIKELAESL